MQKRTLPYNINEKFSTPRTTAKGEQRARVDLIKLETLWLNTGTLCNIECENCYIESSPTNDRLLYLTLGEAREFLDEIKRENLGTKEIAITGGEPFMNPDIISMMELILQRGFKLLVLTNAMKPMQHKYEPLLDLLKRYGDQMILRISVDHFTQKLHEEERGKGSWRPMITGLEWLAAQGFTIDIAGRTRWGEDEAELRNGFAALFTKYGVKIDAQNPKELMLFPEMDEKVEVPEITTDCWDILKVHPDSMMCASSRMVVKRKGQKKPTVLACTLLPYDEEFEIGSTLKEANTSVYLNHPHCAKFCVLGGGSCSA